MKTPLTTTLLCAALTTAAWVHPHPLRAADVPGFRIQEPPGMRAVVTQKDGIVDIRFVPKDQAVAAKPAAGRAKAGAAAEVDEDAKAAAPGPSPWGGSSGPAADAADALISQHGLDQPITAIPAFLALDVTPETVDSPASPRDFAASLLNGVDKDGTLQNGIALETAIFRTLGLSTIDSEVYQASWSQRLLYNTSFSLATSKAAEDSEELQLAIGFSTILYESANRDPYRNKGLLAAVRGTPPPTPVFGPEDIPEESASNIATLTQATELFRQQQWKGAIWTAAIAPVWSSPDGKASNLESQGFTAWTTWGYGFDGPFTGSKMQILGHLRYRADEPVTSEEDKDLTAEQNSLIAATRLRIGQPEFNGFLEGAYVRLTDGLEGDGDAWRIAAGVEKKLANNVWLVISAGQQFSDESKPSDEEEFFAVGALRFGTSQSPVIGK